MGRITEGEYLAALALCKSYIAQCKDDADQIQRSASRFEGIKKLGLSSRAYNVISLVVGRAESTSQELEILRSMTKKDLRRMRGLGVKSRIEVVEKLSSYGIEIK